MSVLKIKDNQNNWTSINTINGRTPEKGVDYWTNEDKDEIVEYVIDSDEISDALDAKLDSPSTAGTAGQVLTSNGSGGQTWEDPTVAVEDVQIDGTSILDNGVADVPKASSNNLGVVKTSTSIGIKSDGSIGVIPATTAMIKAGVDNSQAITSGRQHNLVFYGLAKAAGHDESESSNSIGTYTDEAKAAIQTMLDVPSKADLAAIQTMSIHICTAQEYDSSTGVPTIQNPDEKTFYLVPSADGASPDLFTEWAYVNNAWEMFGSATIDLSEYVTKDSLDNAGITNKEFTTIKEFEVTTTDHGEYGILEDITSEGISLLRNSRYRITFDGTEYLMYSSTVVIEQPWSEPIFVAVGDISLNPDINQNIITNYYYTAPFCLLDSNTQQLIYTNTTGNHTVKIEAETKNVSVLPKELIYGEHQNPYLSKTSGPGFAQSIGINNIEGSSLGSAAIGLANTVSGVGAVAIGTRNISNGNNTTTVGGWKNTVSGNYGFASGLMNTVSSSNGVALGSSNTVSGNSGVALGSSNTASGNGASAFGRSNIANHKSQVVIGEFNVADTSEAAATARGNYVEIVGNGTANDARSNARTLDWSGNEVLAGKLTVGADPTNNMDVATKQYVDGKEIDVQVDGTSILSNGVANFPIANDNTLGVVKTSSDIGGIIISRQGSLTVNPANSSLIKGGANQFKPIVPYYQDQSTFYGLAKAAGDTTQAQSSNAVGIYTDDAKSAIQMMLGVPSEDDVVNDVQINGTSILNDGVANIPIATPSKFGILKTNSSKGIYVDTTDGTAYTVKASSTEIKQQVQAYKPVVPANQHESTFYGLAKAAGDATQSASSNAVGVYTDGAKAAIKDMLGITDGAQTVTVTGTAPTITANPNTRYICDEVLSLDFTPCSVGTCNVVFTSGSTPTLLTLPQTVRMPEWFIVEENMTYEISITDGVYGAVMEWVS